MTNKRKKGFTLVELMVVLVILGIIAAIAVPLFINYWKKAEFRKNEENAKTVYLAAESRLTYYRSSGQWEQFKKEMQDAVKDTDSEIAQKAVFKDNKDSRLNGRIYTIKLNKSAADQTKENNLVLRLLDDYTYDKGFLDASISIEIDIESGEVYSAFYGSRCKGLNYKADDVDGYLTMQKRDYDSRSKRLLGYYSTEDTVNTVNLETKRLRITTINLVNSEKLSLDWSSNVGADLGVDYEVSFYKNDDNTKLFTLRVSPFDMGQQGWSTNADSTSGMATLELTKADGTKDTSNWMFPVTYSDNKYSVVLDAMMSAKVQAALDGQTNESAKSELEKTSSTSITRLATIITALSEPQNIYAKVKATAYTGSSNINISQEYRDSEQVSSNVANTMFGDNTKGSDIQVAAFRHLSNMRYYEKNHDSATFTLTNKNMDWASVGTGLYDFKAEAQPDGTKVEKLAWRENTKTETVGFPSIKELPKEYTLTGKGSQTLVSNLHLDEESVADDTTTTNLNVSRLEFLGLFCELKGTVNEDGQDVDFAWQTTDGCRQRVNIFCEQKKIAATIRLLNQHIPTLEELKIPTTLYQLSEEPRGIILVTGPTGSGKSTTLAAVIEAMNQKYDRHIITIEDPIEYVYECKKSLIHQREVGQDVTNFASALRSALREDPDVILVGEMRDYETISAALLAAETGHLVLSTLHTTGAAQTVERIIDACPAESQNQVRIQLAGTLKGIISQCLIPCGGGMTRVPATEFLTGSDAILNLIREGKTHQISAMMQSSAASGMHTLNMDLSRLMQQGYITREEAMKFTNNKAELTQYM